VILRHAPAGEVPRLIQSPFLETRSFALNLRISISRPNQGVKYAPEPSPGVREQSQTTSAPGCNFTPGRIYICGNFALLMYRFTHAHWEFCRSRIFWRWMYSYEGFGNARCAGAVHQHVQGWHSLSLVKFAIVNFITNSSIDTLLPRSPANCAETISKLFTTLYY
jgi:hypothetical protein